MEWATFDVPLTKGVDLRSPARAVETGRLLAAENLVFDQGRAGLVRRRGHKGVRVRGSGTPDAAGPPEVTVPGSGAPGTLGAGTDWLYGWGTLLADDQTEAADPGAEAGFFRGAAQRGAEELAWDGFRLWSVGDENAPVHPSTPAPLPVAVSRAIARDQAFPQTIADIAVGTSLTVVAWEAAGAVLVSVYDNATGAPYLSAKDTGLSHCAQVRAVPMGDWVHVLSASTTDLDMVSFHASNPTVVRPGNTNLGNCDTYFDARVIDDTSWAVVKRDTSDAARLTYLNADGSADESLCAANTTLGLGGGGANCGKLAFAIHPVTREVALIYEYATDTLGDFYLNVVVYTAGGVTRGNINLDGYLALGVRNLTIDATYLPVSEGKGQFTGAYDFKPSIGTATVTTFQATHSNVTAKTEYQHKLLSHHAFRVGHEVFLGIRNAYPSNGAGVQLSYFFVDRTMRPCGRLEPGTASFDLRSVGLPSVHPVAGQGDRNRTQFVTSLTYRTRVDSADNDQYDEDGIKLVTLDFLAPLRSAEYGQSTYFPGCGLHVYDGRAVAEAGFYLFPEFVTGSSNNGTPAGNLVPGAIHRYKARWLHRNAQGEETLSAATLTNAITVAPGDDVINVVVNQDLVTAKGTVMLLLYRNEGGDGVTTGPGTQWYLVTSRDPGSSDAVFYDPGSATVTFEDGLSDTDLISREKDPGDAGLLETFAPPASEVIAAGRDRLWLAGGELPDGDLLPSMTMQTGKGPGFTQFLQTAVDKGGDPITAVGFMGHSVLVFQETGIHAFEADGPSNLGQGGFDAPRKIVADTGAVMGSPAVLTTAGILYKAPSGYQLLATNFQVMDVGDPVKPLAEAATLAGVVAVPKDSEVRFYHSDASAAVFNYRTGEWTTFTGLRAAGATRGASGYARLAMPDGRWLRESPGQWSDDGQGYTGHLRTSHLRVAGVSDVQRVRRVAILGDVGSGSPKLQFQAFYNDRDWPEDEWTWEPRGADLNPSVWGDTTWGAGTWGDTASDGDPAVRDSVLYARRRLRRQKCSRFVLDVQDTGLALEGPAFTAISIEYGRKSGLTRRPTSNT